MHDFVHTGDRIYVATTRGLFALENDPSAHRQDGRVLEVSESMLEGDPPDVDEDQQQR